MIGLSTAGSPRLLDRLRETCRVRHYSLRMEDSYAHWVRRYVLFHGKRHPQEMGEAEVNRFLTWLAVEGQVSASYGTHSLHTCSKTGRTFARCKSCWGIRMWRQQ